MLFGSRLLGLGVGVVLLVVGRRLYWLLVGLVGFVLGFTLVAEVLEGPAWAEVLGGVLGGLLASGLAVLFQKVVIAVAGLLIGAMAVLWWAEKMAWGNSWWLWLLAAIAGLAGAWLVRTLFEVGLIVLSSVMGAAVVLEAIARPPDELSPIFLALVAGGILIQSLGSRRRGRG